MESLALIAGLMFVLMILIGPLCFLLSKINFIPKSIVWILSIISIAIGLWWIFLPIPAVKYLGLIPIFLGALSLKKKTDA